MTHSPTSGKPVQPWLSIIGIGEDGIDGLTPAARGLISQAVFLVGGRRHLALVPDFAGETLAWPSPIELAFPAILARRGEPVVVLGSGDPFFYGIGSTLSTCIDKKYLVIHANITSVAAAFAAIGEPWHDAKTISLHGKASQAFSFSKKINYFKQSVYPVSISSLFFSKKINYFKQNYSVYEKSLVKSIMLCRKNWI